MYALLSIFICVHVLLSIDAVFRVSASTIATGSSFTRGRTASVGAISSLVRGNRTSPRRGRSRARLVWMLRGVAHRPPSLRRCSSRGTPALTRTGNAYAHANAQRTRTHPHAHAHQTDVCAM
eukprot:1336537-Pleurochrysis_carterae.AAC.2